ncbi:hypothetical protein ACFL26_00995 [Patescibacteria group bacterium]
MTVTPKQIEALREHEKIRQALAYVYFREAICLLESARALWIGRLGHGRIRRQQVRGVMSEVTRQFEDIGRTIYGVWSEEPLIGRSDDWTCRSKLSSYRDNRYPRVRHFEPADRCPDAARRLVHAAVHLLQLGLADLEAAEFIDRDQFARSSMDQVYDQLEIIGDTPLYDPPTTPVSEESLRALRERAVYRTLEGIANAARCVYAWQRRRPDEGYPEMDFWKGALESFRRKAEARYRAFANGPEVPPEERTALTAAMDDADADAAFDWNHCGPDERERSDRHARALITALLQIFEIDDSDWRRLADSREWIESDPDTSDSFDVAFDE